MHLKTSAVLLASTALISVASAASIDESEALARVVTVTVEAHAPQANEEKALLGVRLSSSERGVVIESTIAGSAADKAGLEAGDVILKVNGKPASVEGLVGTVQKSTPGTLLKLAVARGDSLKRFKVKLGAAPQERRQRVLLRRIQGPEGNGEGVPDGIRTMIIKEMRGDAPNGEDMHVEAKVMLELNGEDFDPENIMEMIHAKLAEQLGGEMDDDQLGELMEHVVHAMESGNHQVVIDLDDNFRRAGRPERNFMDARFQNEFEEQLHHLHELMNERFEEGDHMFGGMIGELHEQFERAGGEIRHQFERAGEHFGQMRERFGRAFEELQERQSHLMRELQEAHEREARLNERVDRLEAMLERLMQGQRQQPRRGADQDRPQRDEPQRDRPRRRGGDRKEPSSGPS